MTAYKIVGVNLNEKQARKLLNAHKKGEGTTIRLTKENMRGGHKLPLTHTQMNKLSKAKNGVQLKLSAAQLKRMEKQGGFLPLAALIPIIAGVASGVGGLAGGISSAVSAAKSNAEQARHNRAIEEKLSTGSGIVANTVGNIPLVGGLVKGLLEKIGLGIKQMNKINKGGCVKCNGYIVGSGLYLSPDGNVTGRGLFLSQGNGLFLDQSQTS
jgi:hypothetical protein